MKKIYFSSIQSYIDVITNSSTEIFVYKQDGEIKRKIYELLESIKNSDARNLIKDNLYVIENTNDEVNLVYINECYISYTLSEIFSTNDVLQSITQEELYDFFKQLYNTDERYKNAGVTCYENMNLCILKDIDYLKYTYLIAKHRVKLAKNYIILTIDTYDVQSCREIQEFIDIIELAELKLFT